jgi:6-phospho-beta-glucosidase
MARIKLAYIGGGSTRAPGTMASFIDQGENFDGSEVVLIDIDRERLAVVEALAQRMVRDKALDIGIASTTDRRAGLEDCDTVLTSFRPGGFEARHIDESVPLKHGVIGQETQGPGGFFMALRSIHAMRDIIRDMEKVCPRALLVNYTNPVNIVSEAVTHLTDIPVVSLCEGPIVSPRELAEIVGLDPAKVETVSIGLNHGSWSVRHLYDGEDMIPLLREAYERKNAEGAPDSHELRHLELAATMGSIPSTYFQYYYYEDEMLEELLAKPTTRAQDIMAEVSGYWRHYGEQLESDAVVLDPERSRRGMQELELAVDLMDAVFNDRDEVWPVNVPNMGSIADFPDDLVVETIGYVDGNGVAPITQGHLPPQVAGLVKMLAEYQSLTAQAASSGTRLDAIRALASNPLVLSTRKAEAIYDEMSALLKDHLPERLLSG